MYISFITVVGLICIETRVPDVNHRYSGSKKKKQSTGIELIFSDRHNNYLCFCSYYFIILFIVL